MFVLVGTKLGYWASLAGCATQMALIPTQVRYAGWLCSPTGADGGSKLVLWQPRLRRRHSSSSGAMSTAPGAATATSARRHPPSFLALPSPTPQAMLVRYIGRLRASTAAQTDERVRLTGEVISGVLATKMLGEG